MFKCGKNITISNQCIYKTLFQTLEYRVTCIIEIITFNVEKNLGWFLEIFNNLIGSIGINLFSKFWLHAKICRFDANNLQHKYDQLVIDMGYGVL